MRDIRVGQRVLVSCISACGRCRFCKEGRYGQCLGGGGWVLGHTIDGTQAERVRVPFADHSLHVLPDNVSNEDALMLADILPTSYEVGVLAGQGLPRRHRRGRRCRPDRAGRAGHSPALQPVAGHHGRPCRVTPRARAGSRGRPRRRLDRRRRGLVVFELTLGLGADVAIEAVGVPSSFELCTSLVRPGGHVANVGVHGEPATLHLETLWIKNVTITTGLVDTRTTPLLLRLLSEKVLDVSSLCTHRFGLDEMQDAYDVFSRAGETGALKVALFSPEAVR